MSDITKDYSFGGWLRDQRVKREITLRRAAELLGMDPGNLSKLERSELEPPKSAKKVTRICKKLGISKATEHIMKSLAFEHHLAILRDRFEHDEEKS